MAVELKKLAPWNWFRNEESEGAASQVARPLARYADNPLLQIHREVDRLFDNMLRGSGIPNLFAGPDTLSGWLRPSVDIAANDKQYTITVEVPGVEESDVALELIEDSLVIRGEKKQERERKDEEFYNVERSYGSFRRVLSLPGDADPEGIDARFRNGVLTITLPRKAQARSAGRRIEIKKAA
jgi:HSP20 family protein